MVKPRTPRAILTACRGLPGSGKTYWARAWLEWMAIEGHRGHLVRVNRDDLRRMMFDSDYRKPTEFIELRVTAAQHAMISALLRMGVSVIVDDTNLYPEHMQLLRELARKCRAEFVIRDFTAVPLDICIARDVLRPDPVGEEIIRDMWARHLAPRTVEQAISAPTTEMSSE